MLKIRKSQTKFLECYRVEKFNFLIVRCLTASQKYKNRSCFNCCKMRFNKNMSRSAHSPEVDKILYIGYFEFLEHNKLEAKIRFLGPLHKNTLF